MDSKEIPKLKWFQTNVSDFHFFSLTTILKCTLQPHGPVGAKEVSAFSTTWLLGTKEHRWVSSWADYHLPRNLCSIFNRMIDLCTNLASLNLEVTSSNLNISVVNLLLWLYMSCEQYREPQIPLNLFAPTGSLWRHAKIWEVVLLMGSLWHWQVSAKVQVDVISNQNLPYFHSVVPLC